MDVSKLPRLSKTDQPPPHPDESSSSDVLSYPPPSPQIDRSALGLEVWLSGIIGIVLLMMGQRFGAYLLSLVTGQAFHTGVDWTTGDRAGQEVKYWELAGYAAWSDGSFFLFGLALVIDALALIVVMTRLGAKHIAISIALFVMALATAFNLVATFQLFSGGVLPIASLLMVAFGGYLIAHQWRLLQVLRPWPDRATGARA